MKGISLVQGLVNDGKSSRSRVKGSSADGGTETKLRLGVGHSEDSASMHVPVLVSIRYRPSGPPTIFVATESQH